MNKRAMREAEKVMLEECVNEVLATADIRGGYKPGKLTVIHCCNIRATSHLSLI